MATVQIRISVLEVWILQQSPKRRWQVEEGEGEVSRGSVRR